MMSGNESYWLVNIFSLTSWCTVFEDVSTVGQLFGTLLCTQSTIHVAVRWEQSAIHFSYAVVPEKNPWCTLQLSFYRFKLCCTVISCTVAPRILHVRQDSLLGEVQLYLQKSSVCVRIERRQSGVQATWWMQRSLYSRVAVPNDSSDIYWRRDWQFTFTEVICSHSTALPRLERTIWESPLRLRHSWGILTGALWHYVTTHKSLHS